MGEKRFKMEIPINNGNPLLKDNETGEIVEIVNVEMLIERMNEQQEYIEELQVSDEMGWKRAEYFEKKCPKELHNKKMYIKRLEYKVQKFKEENEQLRECYKTCENMLSDAIDENELLECKEGVYNVHRLKKDYEQLKKEKMFANAFIVEKGLEVEFVRWCKE